MDGFIFARQSSRRRGEFDRRRQPGGRVHRVYVQADAPYRMLPEDLNNLYVRNAAGGMVPVSALATGRWTYASPRLERYNGFPALNFQGEAAPGQGAGCLCGVDADPAGAVADHDDLLMS